MAIDSNVSGVSPVVAGPVGVDFSGGSQIKTNVSGSVEDAIQKVIDKVKEKSEEILEQVELEAEESVNDYLDPNNIDWDKYQARLDEIIKNSTDERDATVKIAEFMAYEFPKLHYFWGGGHDLTDIEEFQGLNRNWGSNEAVTFGLSKGWALGEEFPYSFDCSGFVTWVLVNAGVNIGDYYKGYNPKG